jgi:hypothetical protein
VTAGKSSDAKVYHFACNQWLDEGMGDSKTERTLYPQDPENDSRKSYSSYTLLGVTTFTYSPN